MDIDLVFKIAAIGIVVAVLNQLLVRSDRPDQAMLVSLAGLVTTMMLLVREISSLFELVKTLFGFSAIELLLKVFSLCVITAAVASLLRRNEGELALLLALCAAACAAALLVAAGEPLAAMLRTLADKTGLSGAVFTPLWKVLAIALTVRVGGAFCRDAAQGALASVLETAGAVCALTAAAPLLLAVVELVEGWL